MKKLPILSISPGIVAGRDDFSDGPERRLAVGFGRTTAQSRLQAGAPLWLRLRRVAAVFLAVGAMAYGQGTFEMANRRAVTALDAPIADALGTKLSGDAFLAQLWAAPVGSAAFKAYGDPVPFKSGVAAGYFLTLVPVTLADVTPGGKVDVEIRAWRASAGATYDAAVLAPMVAGGNYGISLVISGLATGGVPDPATGIPSVPSPLVGLQGFSFIVPEPSIMALGLLGAAFLVLRRRYCRNAQGCPRLSGRAAGRRPLT
jgi:hypothetical protein